MKTPTLQFGIIVLSALLIVSVGILTFSVIKEFVGANLLEETLGELDPQRPLSFETRMAKGDQLFEAEQYKLAATEYSIALSIEKNAEEATSKLGTTYLKMGSYPEALNSLKRAYELKPNDRTRVNYSVALLRNKQFDEAESLLAEANQEHQETVFYTSVLEAYLGEYEEAQSSLEKALSLSGSVSMAYLQNFQNAFDIYYAQQGGQAVYLKALLSKALIDAEEYPMAEELCLQTLNEKNDYRDVWILLGYAQLQMEKFTEAEDAFKQAKKLDAVKAETHYFLGMSLFKQEKYTEAVDSFELALLYDFKPESEAYIKLAESQTKLGNYEDALAAYEYLIKIDGKNFTLFKEPMRIATEVLGDLGRALTLEESTSYFPNEAQSYVYLAHVYLKRSEIEKANTAIDTAFDINPELASAHYTAGLIRLAEENKEGAKWEFKKTYELSKPGDPLSLQAAEAYNALILSPEAAP